MAPIHHRTPVILDAKDYAMWLGEQEATPEELLALLKPFPAERMEAFPVGLAVDDVRQDEPSLLEPLEIAVTR